MWSKRRALIAGGAVAAALFLLCAPRAVAYEWMVRQASDCDERTQDNGEKIDCWLHIALKPLASGDIDATYDVFDYLYDTYPIFGATGCHRHAHQVGDTAYYEFFVARGLQLEDMRFPQRTTSCGYGFFHGFIEHLIQDRPDAKYVVETCEYLRERLSARMRDIGTICYHASGHGFTQAQADVMTKNEWGHVDKLARRPLELCETLPTSESEIEDCREGVFNVLSDWMGEENFGLTFDYEHPFAVCNAIRQGWQYACYYEFGQRLYPIAQDDPVRAADYVQSIRDKELREMTFGVMIAGMMERQAPLNGFLNVANRCALIDDQGLYLECIRSSANGMMEHGSPTKEYEKVLELCADPSIAQRGAEQECYKSLAMRLSRFYAPEKKLAICGMFPKAYKESCASSR